YMSAGIMVMMSCLGGRWLGWIDGAAVATLDPVGNAASHSDDLAATGSKHTGGNAGAVAAATNDSERDIARNVMHILRKLTKMEVQRTGNVALVPFIIAAYIDNRHIALL